MYNAIVLAGGISNKFGAVQNEALLDIGGKPMLLFVLAALEKSRFIERIFVTGPVGKLRQFNFSDRVVLVQSGASIMDTVAAGIKAAASTEKILITTVDIPFLTAAAVDDFIELCQVKTADLYYPVVEKETLIAKFSGAEKTCVKLQDGVFTGGNLFLVNPAILPSCMKLAQQVITNRKKPWRLAALLGWMILLRFVCGYLSLAKAQDRVSQLLQIECCVIRSPYAEVGMDIDRADDLTLAMKYVQR